jgi:hypothetical protein
MKKEFENSEKMIHQVVGKDTGFAVPKNYFEKIEDHFSLYLFEEKNTKKTNFEIPTNYFNTLEDSILQKVIVPKNPVKVISLKQRILKRVPLIAAAVVVLFIGLNAFNFEEQASPTFEEITAVEMENWLDHNANNIITEELGIMLAEDDFLNIDFVFTEIEEINIEHYISTNDDLTILNELY